MPRERPSPMAREVGGSKTPSLDARRVKRWPESERPLAVRAAPSETLGAPPAPRTFVGANVGFRVCRQDDSAPLAVILGHRYSRDRRRREPWREESRDLGGVLGSIGDLKMREADPLDGKRHSSSDRNPFPVPLNQSRASPGLDREIGGGRGPSATGPSEQRQAIHPKCPRRPRRRAERDGPRRVGDRTTFHAGLGPQLVLGGPPPAFVFSGASSPAPRERGCAHTAPFLRRRRGWRARLLTRPRYRRVTPLRGPVGALTTRNSLSEW